MNKEMFTSKTDLWATPQKFFDDCNAKYGPFDIDVCADATNAKCSVYFDKEIDGRKIFIEGIKKSGTYPSEAHPFSVCYLLTLPLSRFLTKFIPKFLALRTLQK
jgi:hypothetical protein